MNTRIHELKTWPEPFRMVVAGNKPFEFRRDDRGFAVGDYLRLKYWDPSPNWVGKTAGHDREKDPWTMVRVTYCIGGKFGIPENFVCMGIQPVLFVKAHALVPGESAEHYNQARSNNDAEEANDY